MIVGVGARIGATRLSDQIAPEFRADPLDPAVTNLVESRDMQFCTADKLSIRYGPEARPFDPLIDTRLEALTQNTACPFN